MANTIRTFYGIRIDPFQAVKRAFIHKGSIPPVKQPEFHGSKTGKTSQISDLGSLPVSNEAMSAESPEVKEHSGTMDREDKRAEEGPEEIIELTERTHEVLFEADTVFPFTLFPSTITLDREKLTIAQRFFWRMAEITSVPVSEILTCKVDVGPFFGSLHLVFSFFADNQRTVSFLKRSDAIKLQRMLHGYIIAHKREINTTNVGIDDLKIMLKEIGQGATE